MSAVVVELDALLLAAERAEALASIAAQLYDAAAPELDERLAYLLGSVAEFATAVVAAVNRLRVLVADQQPAGAGDDWGGEGGTR